MDDKDNVHQGHRERMLKKFMNYPHSLVEHEVLEAILFYGLPRKDTNPLAHRLLKRFGSLDKVFSATVFELKTVDGVGDKVAGLIKLIGKSVELCKEQSQAQTRFNNFADIKKELLSVFNGIEYEVCVVLLADKNRFKLCRLEFTDIGHLQVEMHLPEITSAIAFYKPQYLIMAHNHPSGNYTPSVEDDLSTKRVKLLCDLHGVALLDHVIYGKDDFYSYHHSGRMNSVNNDTDINILLTNSVNKEK